MAEEVIEVKLKGFSWERSSLLRFRWSGNALWNQKHHVRRIPKVRGEVTSAWAVMMNVSYLTMLKGEVFPVSSPRVAEVSNPLKNVFRSLTSSSCKELAILCGAWGHINIWEMIYEVKGACLELCYSTCFKSFLDVA